MGEPRFLFSFSLPNVSQIKQKRRLNTSGGKSFEIIEPFFDVMPGTSLFQVLTVLFVSLWSLNDDKMCAHVTVFQNKMSQKIKVARALSKAIGNSQFYLQIRRFWLFQLTRVVYKKCSHHDSSFHNIMFNYNISFNISSTVFLSLNDIKGEV